MRIALLLPPVLLAACATTSARTSASFTPTHLQTTGELDDADIVRVFEEKWARVLLCPRLMDDLSPRDGSSVSVKRMEDAASASDATKLRLTVTRSGRVEEAEAEGHFIDARCFRTEAKTWNFGPVRTMGTAEILVETRYRTSPEQRLAHEKLLAEEAKTFCRHFEDALKENPTKADRPDALDVATGRARDQADSWTPTAINWLDTVPLLNEGDRFLIFEADLYQVAGLRNVCPAMTAWAKQRQYKTLDTFPPNVTPQSDAP